MESYLGHKQKSYVFSKYKPKMSLQKGFLSDFEKMVY